MIVTHHLLCYDCGTAHPVEAPTIERLNHHMSDWRERHQGHKVKATNDPDFWHQSNFRHNASVLEAFQTLQTVTNTNYITLGNSKTAGWGSAVVDNSSNLYLDALVMAHFGSVAVAPANNKAIYLYAYGSLDNTDLTTNGAAANPGTEGTMTFADITTTPLPFPILGVCPYNTSTTAFNAGPFSVAACFGGILPPYWGLAAINWSGMTNLSGATLKYKGLYNTIA